MKADTILLQMNRPDVEMFGKHDDIMIKQIMPENENMILIERNQLKNLIYTLQQWDDMYRLREAGKGLNLHSSGEYEPMNSPASSSLPSSVDWKKLREKFFNECTLINKPEARRSPHFNISPPDLFEWFKTNINGEDKG